MALHKLKSMAHDDEDLYDLARGMPPDYEPPEYPGGLCFCVPQQDLEKLGGAGAEAGATTRFSAMGEVTSTMKGIKECRIEVELSKMAGEDGKYFELSSPAHICFRGPELEKVEMSDNAEVGDTVHLIGTARLESVSDHRAMDAPMACLQITELTYEDESAEARRG